MHEGNLYKCETYDFLLPELPIHLTVPPEIVNAKTPKCIQAHVLSNPNPVEKKRKAKSMLGIYKERKEI